MGETELIHKYSFDPMDGSPRINGEVRADANFVYSLHDGEVDHFLPKAVWLQSLQAKGYEKLNKYGQMQYNYLNARANNGSK